MSERRRTAASLAALIAIGGTLTLVLAASPHHLQAQRPARPPTARVAPPETRQRRVLEPIPISTDSALADDEAFRTLPRPAREVLDVRRHIRPTGNDPGITCVPLSTTSDGSRRLRLQGRLTDGLALVVFARATRRGTLARVEFVRRLATGGQTGYTWDAEGDATTAMDWPPGSTEATTHPVPRGGPIPRALRGLGRIALSWRCVER